MVKFPVVIEKKKKKSKEQILGIYAADAIL